MGTAEMRVRIVLGIGDLHLHIGRACSRLFAQSSDSSRGTAWPLNGIGLHRDRDCLSELVPLRIAGRNRDVGRAGRARRSLEHEHGLVADLANRHVLHDDVVDMVGRSLRSEPA